MNRIRKVFNTLIARNKVRNANFWTALKTNTRFKYLYGASIAFVSASTVASVWLCRNLMPHDSSLLPTLLGTLVAAIIAILVQYYLVYPQLRKLRKGNNG